MTRCKPRCERLTLAAECDLEGFDLIVCARCDRPIRVIVKNKPRPRVYKGRRGDLNRALRASRRAR